VPDGGIREDGLAGGGVEVGSVDFAPDHEGGRTGGGGELKRRRDTEPCDGNGGVGFVEGHQA